MILVTDFVLLALVTFLMLSLSTENKVLSWAKFCSRVESSLPAEMWLVILDLMSGFNCGAWREIGGGMKTSALKELKG